MFFPLSVSPGGAEVVSQDRPAPVWPPLAPRVWGGGTKDPL